MKCVVSTALTLWLAISAASAAELDVQALAAENAALKARVAALEAKNAELSQMLRTIEKQFDTLLGKRAAKPAATEPADALFRKYAKNYVAVGKSFYHLPPMDLSFSNSRGNTPPPQPLEKSKCPESRLCRDDEIKHWKTRLPEWKIGAFGSIPKAKILRILGEEDCIVECRLVQVSIQTPTGSYYLGPEPRTFRLFGVETKNKVDGDTIEAGIIAIIGTWQEYAGGQTMLLAIPVDLAKRGLTEDEFVFMLAMGVDPEADAAAAAKTAGR